MTTTFFEEDVDMVREPSPDDGFVPHAFGDLQLFTRQIADVSVEDQLILDENQPRRREQWESAALRNQILQARGLFTPPLVEPVEERTPDGRPKFKVIDGHRRITALLAILRLLDERHRNGTLSDDEHASERARYSHVSVECTHRPLSQDELVRVWILIHRERKEWSLSEREATAQRLIQIVGHDAAARFLGVTVPTLMKLSDTYDYAERIRVSDDAQQETGKDPRMTWAREIRNLRADIRADDEVIESVITRINAGQIRNSKDVRVLRDLYPQYRDEILDTSKELVRDIALPRGVEDPVRATRSRRGSGPVDLGGLLAEMTSSINAIKLEQLQTVRATKDKRAATRKEIQAMMERLKELDDFIG